MRDGRETSIEQRYIRSVARVAFNQPTFSLRQYRRANEISLRPRVNVNISKTVSDYRSLPS